uniref:Uncharacterized protein n=1 Tax=Suricata suricatta TaxID=37032 RepID=A0A673VHU9_SURSU
RTASCSLTALSTGSDSRGGRDFKQKTIKENSEEIRRKEKECQNQQSPGGAVPAGKAACMHRFKTRPVWPSRWLCAGGQGVRVLSEENQSPERQINIFFFLRSCNKGVYSAR